MKWNSKKVLVTGAAGFIGSHVAQQLLRENAYVIALDNFSYGIREKIPPCQEIFIGDVLDEDILSKIRDVDYVFHFASPSSVILFNKDPKTCMHVTVCGLIKLLEWAKKIGVEKFIYPSSGSVYGNIDLPQSEDAIPKPVNLYAVSKLACEHILYIYSEDIPSVVLRIFAGYGPGEEHKKEYASVVTLFLNAIIKDEPCIIYGDGSQSRDFVYIDDIVKAVIKAVEKNTGNYRIINVGSGNSYTFTQVIDEIERLLGKKAKRIYIDKPRKYLENTLADITRMRQELEIEPLNLKDGLAKYVSKLL